MKRCPECRRDYYDDTLLYCLDDGNALLEGPATDSSGDEPATAMFGVPPSGGNEFGDRETQFLRGDTSGNEPPKGGTQNMPQVNATDRTMILPSASVPRPTSSVEYLVTEVRKNRRAVAVGLTILILAAAGFGYWFFKIRSVEPAPIASIAVLPFQNKSGDADTDYLSDGLAESLIYRLSQLPNLKVSPVSSVIRYKGKDTDVAQIAKELGVQAVMSGRMNQRGDNLNISIELIDAANNKVIWGEQYERKMSELLATQREIATMITEKLQLKFSGDEAKGITKKYTNSNDAYQLYLKARYHFAKRTKADMLQAADYYRQAIAIDPNFALAYARIAEVYLNLPSYPYTSPSESLPQGKDAVEKALEIDPTLSEAHTFKAFYLASYDWKWPEAESEFKRAIELDPTSSAAHFRYGQLYLMPMGRFDEGMAEMKKALDMEPFDMVIGGTYAWGYFVSHQNDKALDIAKKTYDLEPNHPIARFNMALTLNAAGRYDDALAISESALKTDPTSQFMLMQAGISYARTGRHDKAEEVLKKFDEIGKTEYVTAYNLAIVQVALGHRDEAFALIEKAYQAHDWPLIRLKVDPWMEPLRDDPRFADLVRRIGLSG